MTTRAAALSAFAWAKQPVSKVGLSFGASMPRSFEATSAGTTTTVVSTVLEAYTDSNDDVVGWIIECASATNTQNQGLRRRIKKVNDATSTYTFDALPAATADGDEFHLYQPPHLLAVARSAASSTNKRVGTRDRNETNGRFHGYAQIGGYYLLPIHTPRASTTNSRPSTTNVRLVKTNTATTRNVRFSTALGGSVSLGDYFEIWKFPSISGKLIDVQAEMLQREQIVGSFGRPKSIVANRGGSGSPELNYRGSGAGRACQPTDADEALSCVFDVTATGGNDTIDSDSDGTTLALTSGGLGAVGQMILTAGGFAAMITAKGATSYTVSPTIPTPPKAGETIYTGRTYRPATALRAALSIMQWRSTALLEYLWGCVPSPTFSGEKGQFAKIALPMQVADWMRLGATGTELARVFVAKLPTVDELKLGVGRLVLDGVEWSSMKYSFDPGLNVQATVNLNAPNQHGGFALGNDEPKLNVDVFYDASERKSLDDFIAGKAIELLLQFGSVPGFPGAFAIYAPKVIYTGPEIDEESGLLKLTLPMDVTYDPTVVVPRWAYATF